jgi:hypothetical protein
MKKISGEKTRRDVKNSDGERAYGAGAMKSMIRGQMIFRIYARKNDSETRSGVEFSGGNSRKIGGNKNEVFVLEVDSKRDQGLSECMGQTTE